MEDASIAAAAAAADATQHLLLLSLKEQKERFVTGHDGTTAGEILLVSAAAPIGIWLFQSLRALEAYIVVVASSSSSSPPADKTTSSSIVWEALVLWLPLMVCQTNLLYPWGVILLYGEVQICVLISVYFWTTKRWMRIRKMDNNASTSSRRREPTVDEQHAEPTEKDNDNDHQQQHQQQQQQNSIMKDTMTVYRSSMQYMTFVAILAVDFHVFPRRFAKTEVAGYGLMDLGAGSFVVAAGLVSPRSRYPKGQHKQQQQQQQRRRFGKKEILRILPLYVIGLIRLATNKGLEYQEHVSEYGVHWNFFFTLAFVTPLGAMLPGRPHWIVPVLLLTGYQVALSLFGGQDFMEHAPRDHCSSEVLSDLIGSLGNAPFLLQLCTLFAANREGILGCIGYLFLYLAAEYLAFAQLWVTATSLQNKTRSLWILTGGLWACLYFLTEHLGIPVSRRSTNAGFCVWALAHNMILLAAIHTALCVYEDPRKLPGALDSTLRPRVPIVFQAVNRHGLLTFLVANLLTGLTNLSINTLAVSDSVALLILFVYLCAVGGFALVLHHVLEKTVPGKGSNKRGDKAKTE